MHKSSTHGNQGKSVCDGILKLAIPGPKYLSHIYIPLNSMYVTVTRSHRLQAAQAPISQLNIYLA